MAEFLFYVFVAIVVAFIQWKRNSQDILDDLGYDNFYIDSSTFWIMVLAPSVLWPIVVPIYITWTILNYIYCKLFIKPKN